jgi:transposase-like protein
MKYNCPNLCSKDRFSIKKDGHYFRRDDSRYIQRFQCKICKKKFSKTTSSFEYRHKKRRINIKVLDLLSTGKSQRSTALSLGVNPKTIAYKFKYLGKKCSYLNEKWRQEQPKAVIENAQFDDLITIEHTKLKPVTVTSMVNTQTREILALNAGEIRAFGLLAELSRKKYGERENKHPEVLEKTLSQASPLLNPKGTFSSDEHPLYPKVLKTIFPLCSHVRFKGGRGCVSGQGELKKMHFDPLFRINHTYAMLRANINRLFRKTWCTTKKIKCLQWHLEIYMWFHNHVKLKKGRRFVDRTRAFGGVIAPP